MSVNVLHTDPAGQGQRGVGPNPVHHGSQLRQKRNQAKTEGTQTWFSSCGAKSAPNTQKKPIRNLFNSLERKTLTEEVFEINFE